MARTVLSQDDLVNIEKDYNIVSNASLAKKWHIGAARLTKEMDSFYNSKQIKTTLTNKKKGTRINNEETKDIIRLYTVDTMSISAISKELLRSPTAVRSVLIRSNIPIRTSKKTSSKVKIFGDMTTEIVLGDRVYSKKYNSYATVCKLLSQALRIWVEDSTSENSGGFFAHQSRKDLAFISR